MSKWDERFLELAKQIASWSKDPSTQVGCVVVGPDREIRSTGFNGLPRGIEDSEERRWSSIIFMIILFIVTCFIAKGMKINFPKSDRKKLVTTGMGSYIFLYLFAWIMTYTLLNLPKEDFSLPFT